MAKGNFFSELKRRNVYRVGAAYVVGAFVLIEVVSNVAPMFDLPAWIGRAITLLLIIGLPAVLCFAWVYEITPDGVKRTAEVDQDASVTHQTGHRLNIVIIALMVVLSGLYGAQLLLVPNEVADQRAGIAAPTGTISIAVLPFVNLSGDASQEFFSDGMTEEITSALAKVPSLRVVARTSAFEFKGENKDVRAIGQALNASHLLEGSVRKVGTRVRITGQLIRADDGTHIWTEIYDRELTDIFATQDDIAQAIAGALRIPLGLKQGETLVANRAIDPGNYQQYLRAKAVYRGRVDGNAIREAIGIVEQVVARDPAYAPAWALLALAYDTEPAWNANDGLPIRRPAEEQRRIVDANLPKAEAAAHRAIELDPRNADAYAGLAYALHLRGSLLEAEDLFRQALKLDAFNPDLLHLYSLSAYFKGRVKEAVAMREQLRSLEPLVPIFNRFAAHNLLAAGQNEVALAITKALPANDRNRTSQLSAIYALMGRYGDAADVLLSASADLPSGEAEAAARLLRVAPATVPPRDLPDLQSNLSFVYLYVGAPERFIKDVLDGLERAVVTDYRFYVGSFWSLSYAPARKTERFKVLVRKLGLVDYWRARGWPDVCRPVGADDFACE